MVCTHCDAELDPRFEFCPSCGARAVRMPAGLSRSDVATKTKTPSFLAHSSVGLSVLTLVLYLTVPYVSIGRFSITGWQLNWFHSWQFWPPSGRWLCISLVLLTLAASLHFFTIRQSRRSVVGCIIQLLLSIYLIVAMTRLFVKVPSIYFGDIITPWIILTSAVLLMVLGILEVVVTLKRATKDPVTVDYPLSESV
jgi:hypothetical protein